MPVYEIEILFLRKGTVEVRANSEWEAKNLVMEEMLKTSEYSYEDDVLSKDVDDPYIISYKCDRRS